MLVHGTSVMPLLDHFHPPLHGPRRWEGFHHSWAAFIAQQLNQQFLPSGYFAESEISLGPELEIDVATMEDSHLDSGDSGATATAIWSPPRPKYSVPVDFAHLDSYEIRVYQDLGGAQLRAAIELVSPSNKDRPGSRRTFTAKCAGYLKHGIGLVIVDVVTLRSANLHAELCEALEISGPALPWESPTGLSAVAYRPVTELRKPRLEIWPHKLTLGRDLPELPLWLALDLCVPVRLEESYQATCQSLRISA
jgi:hypothetical protein